VKVLRPKAGSKSPLSIAFSAVVVVSSVAGAWLFIDSNRTTEVFLVTQQNLASGTPLEIANLDRVELSLFGLAGAYLQAESLLEGAYLQRPIGSGEAIPLSAVTNQDQNNWSNLVLTPQVPVSTLGLAASGISKLW
jgi:flagella basal body P-ring formation protein FlgA